MSEALYSTFSHSVTLKVVSCMAATAAVGLTDRNQAVDGGEGGGDLMAFLSRRFSINKQTEILFTCEGLLFIFTP